MNETTASRLPRHAVTQFLRGLTYPLDGLRYLRRHRLWGMAALPLVVNVVLLVVLVYGTWALLGPLLGSVSDYLRGLAPQMELLKVLLSVLVGLFWMVAFFLVLGINAMVLLLVGQAVASPALDLLSEKVEVQVLSVAPVPFGVGRFLRSIGVALGDLVGGLVLLVVVNVPIFLLSLTGIGAAPAAVGSFAFSAMLLAHEFVGLSLARHLVTYRGRWRIVRANAWLSLGFGTSAMLILMVPVLNLVLLPLASVGGTLLYCDLRRDGRLPRLAGPAAGDFVDGWDH